MDDLLVLKIELAAMRACEKRDPDGQGTLGSRMTDADLRYGVLSEFGGIDGFELWMIDPLVEQVKEAIAFRATVVRACEMFVGSMILS